MHTDKSVYLLVGDEEFLKEEWLHNTKQRHFRDISDSADYNLFFADSIIPADIFTIARTRPFLSTKRLIVIKNIESLKSQAYKDEILSYVKRPSSNTILILEAAINQREVPADKFLNEIGQFSEVVAFKKLYDANLYSWISQKAILRKKRIEPMACELLKQLKGNSLKALDEELEKLSLYAGSRPLITAADVEQLVGKDYSSSIYDLIDAISQNDKKRALSLSFDFPKSAIGGIVGLFCWNLRLLLNVKQGNTPALRKFQLDRAVKQANRLSEEWLKAAISELTAFDLQIKTSSFYDSFLGWQMLLVRLLSLTARSSGRPYFYG